VYIVRSCVFKFSLDNAQKSFYRAANSVFGKIGRIASEVDLGVAAVKST